MQKSISIRGYLLDIGQAGERDAKGEENILLPFKTRLSDPYNTTLEKHSFLSQSSYLLP